jgi:radical SAM superfamily enzyme with C-terminal helix-hairpin-helix motif
MRSDPFWLKVFSDQTWLQSRTEETKAEFDNMHRMLWGITIMPGLLMWFGQTGTDNSPINTSATVLRSVFDRACEVEQLPVRGAVIFTGSRPLAADAAPLPLTEEAFARLSVFLNLVRHEIRYPRTV